MSTKVRIEITGMAPGEVPSMLVRIPLTGEPDELAEQLLAKFFGTTAAPVAPLTTRGGDGDDHE